MVKIAIRNGFFRQISFRSPDFDVAGLKTVITEIAHETSATLIEHINSNLQSFVKSEELQGDATIVAIKMKAG